MASSFSQRKLPATAEAMERKRKFWFRFVDGGTGHPLGDTSDRALLPEATTSVDDIRAEACGRCPTNPKPVPVQLKLFANEGEYAAADRKTLPLDKVLGPEFGTMNDPIIVEVPSTELKRLPEVQLVPAAAAKRVQVSDIPKMAELDSPRKLALGDECASLDTWDAGSVHDIANISEFLENLGGCVDKVYWRTEEQKVVSLLLEEWFTQTESKRFGVPIYIKSVVTGSPGIGKSTLLCVVVFYLVFHRNKNVLVYRKVEGADNCLFYMGYRNGAVVYFAIDDCPTEYAVDLYRSLKKLLGKTNIWLVLDGFQYRDTSPGNVPEGMKRFKLLATSQQLTLKSQDTQQVSRYLLSCWLKEDILALGTQVYGYGRKDAEDRFYYSGSNVREFVSPSLEKIKDVMDAAISGVNNVDALFSDRATVLSGSKQSDRLRRTFVKDITVKNSLSHVANWTQLVDSEYAVKYLADRIKEGFLLKVYHWAKASKHNTLAGHAFELCMHKLASEKKLQLSVSEYDPAKKDRHFSGQDLQLKSGSAVNSGTKDDYETELRQFRDNDEYAYWYPKCDNFPNIDSIVKLEPDPNKPNTSSKSPQVAYLQITVAKEHEISFAELKKVNKFFYDEMKSKRSVTASDAERLERQKSAGAAEHLDREQNTGAAELNQQGSASDADQSDLPLYVALCPDEDTCRALVLKGHVNACRSVCRVYVGFWKNIDMDTAADCPRNNSGPMEVPDPSQHNTRASGQKLLAGLD